MQQGLSVGPWIALAFLWSAFVIILTAAASYRRRVRTKAGTALVVGAAGVLVASFLGPVGGVVGTVVVSALSPTASRSPGGFYTLIVTASAVGYLVVPFALLFGIALVLVLRDAARMRRVNVPDAKAPMPESSDSVPPNNRIQQNAAG